MKNIYSRYIRHIILPNIGIKGQDVLKNAKILCVGAGGLGSPALTYIVSTGVGNIDIIDFDIVNITNLNRQVIFDYNDIGKNKALCAKNNLLRLNNAVKIKAYNKKLSLSNILDSIDQYDIILDCTDNLETKFLINDVSMKYNIPLIHASVFGLEGYISIFTKNTHCYRCLYNNFIGNNTLNYGILGSVAAIFGCLQALVTVKLLLYKFGLKNNYLFFNKIIFMDFNTFKFSILNVKKNINCKICL